MAALGEYETAAVLWGAVTEGFFARLIFPASEVSGNDQSMAMVRSQLGHDSYTAATARGAAMAYEQITAFVRAAVEGRRPQQQPRQKHRGIRRPSRPGP
jgi:hypothetical protein